MSKKGFAKLKIFDTKIRWDIFFWTNDLEKRVQNIVRNRQHNFFWQGSKACKAHFQWKLNPELPEDDPLPRKSSPFSCIISLRTPSFLCHKCWTSDSLLLWICVYKEKISPKVAILAMEINWFCQIQFYFGKLSNSKVSFTP